MSSNLIWTHIDVHVKQTLFQNISISPLFVHVVIMSVLGRVVFI